MDKQTNNHIEKAIMGVRYMELCESVKLVIRMDEKWCGNAVLLRRHLCI